jgi:ketosteroid isomerase-like protein
MVGTLYNVESEVVAVAEQESQAISSSDLELYYSLLANDAIYFPPNAAAKTGEELRAWLKDFLSHFRVEWLGFNHGSTVVDRHLATHDYSYGMKSTPKAGGDPIVSYGKGLLILRCGVDGSWKIIRNIWNASPQERPGVR